MQDHAGMSWKLAVVMFVMVAGPVPAAAQPGLQGVSRDIDADFQEFGPRQTGLTFSASLGRGAMDINCANCGDNDTVSEAVSFSGQVGYRFSQRFGVTADLWILEHSGNYWFKDPVWHTAWRVSGTVGPHLYVTENLWVRGGLGLSRHWVDPGIEGTEANGFEPLDYEPTSDKSSGARPPGNRVDETGLAAQAAVGYEILGDRYFSFDIQARSGASLTEDGWAATTAALALGVSWF